MDHQFGVELERPSAHDATLAGQTVLRGLAELADDLYRISRQLLAPLSAPGGVPQPPFPSSAIVLNPATCAAATKAATVVGSGVGSEAPTPAPSSIRPATNALDSSGFLMAGS
ncbi:hypothetical protein ACQEVF_53220 [Nonomuraea polychroma]|uniref:hypothetical protein n=1 Tax=Nonomuraea polychroma TaxID=46176 RepID=UPI003D90CF6E